MKNYGFLVIVIFLPIELICQIDYIYKYDTINTADIHFSDGIKLGGNRWDITEKLGLADSIYYPENITEGCAPDFYPTVVYRYNFKDRELLDYKNHFEFSMTYRDEFCFSSHPSTMDKFIFFDITSHKRSLKISDFEIKAGMDYCELEYLFHSFENSMNNMEYWYETLNNNFNERGIKGSLRTFGLIVLDKKDLQIPSCLIRFVFYNERLMSITMRW